MRWAAAAALAATTSCANGTVPEAGRAATSGPSSSSSLPPSTASLAGEHLDPIDQLVKDALGFDGREINRAAREAQYAWAVRCATEAGYRVVRADFPPDVVPPKPLAMGVIVATVAASIDGTPGQDAASSASSLPADAARARDDCLAKSFDVIPDPEGIMLQWIDQATADMTSAIAADQRIQNAFGVERRCVGELGFGEMLTDELANRYATKAADLVDAFRSGTLERAGLDAQLHDLERQELSSAGGAESCLRSRLAVEDVVAAEYQRKFIEQHGDSIREQVGNVKPLMAALADYLARA